MKKLLFALLFAWQAQAAPSVISSDIVPGTNNLAATYNTSYPQKTLTLGANSNYYTHFSILDENATGVCCDLEDSSASVAPTVGDGHELCVAGSSYFAWDFISLNPYVYCRSASGTLSSGGTIHVQAW
jgi:hypothetical protein